MCVNTYKGFTLKNLNVWWVIKNCFNHSVVIYNSFGHHNFDLKCTRDNPEHNLSLIQLQPDPFQHSSNSVAQCSAWSWCLQTHVKCLQALKSCSSFTVGLNRKIYAKLQIFLNPRLLSKIITMKDSHSYFSLHLSSLKWY